MLRTPQFETFIAPACYKPGLLRFFFAIIVGMVSYFMLTILFVGGTVYTLGLWKPGQDLSSILVLFIDPDTPILMVPVLVSFIPMAIAAVIMAGLHHRSPRSLFGKNPRFWSMFALAIGVIFTVNMLTTAINVAVGGPLNLTQTMPLATWTLHLLWAIPLLFVQTTSEEMIFRGYLQQQLAARFHSAFFWMLMPSILFGFAHYNPEADPTLRWAIVGATGLFGLIAADLTRVTGNLAAAMGLHFANNFFALLLVGLPDELSGLALFHTPFSSEDTELVVSYLWLDVGLLIVIWLVTRLALRRLQSRPEPIN